MSPQLQQVFLFALLPASCMILGGILASIRTPGHKLTNATQHFAAGVVFAAVAIELLPEVIASSSPLTLGIGFTVGMLAMLALKYLAERLEESTAQSKILPIGLLTAVGIDVFIDGLLIGIAFIAGKSGGILLATALAIEIIFLGLSTAVTLHKNKINTIKILLISFLFALLIVIGALIGFGVISHLPKTLLSETLAFGVAALLYLVTEELLAEAHEPKEAPWVTAAFFVGFLVIILLETS